MIPLPDDPKMLAYVQQVAQESGLLMTKPGLMIQGSEGGASPTPEQSGIDPDVGPLPTATAPGRRNRACRGGTESDQDGAALPADAAGSGAAHAVQHAGHDEGRVPGSV